jgi:hypothetical protein
MSARELLLHKTIRLILIAEGKAINEGDIEFVAAMTDAEGQMEKSIKLVDLAVKDEREELLRMFKFVRDKELSTGTPEYNNGRSAGAAICCSLLELRMKMEEDGLTL